MTSVHPTLFYLLVEAAIVLLIINAALIYFFYKKHNNKKKLLSQLVNKLTRNADTRQEELLTQLAEEANNEISDSANEARNKIFQQETELFQYMIRLVMTKDPDVLLELDSNIETLTNTVLASYRLKLHQDKKNQNISSPSQPQEVNTEISIINSKLDMLNEKNEVLLSTIKSISIGALATTNSNNEAAPAAVTDSDLIDEVINETPQSSDEDTNIIDISETPDTNTEDTPMESIDVDALFDAAQEEKPAASIEEIPDDLLQSDEISVNDAATDIDALFAQVANENIGKSATP